MYPTKSLTFSPGDKGCHDNHDFSLILHTFWVATQAKKIDPQQPKVITSEVCQGKGSLAIGISHRQGDPVWVSTDADVENPRGHVLPNQVSMSSMLAGSSQLVSS